MNRKDLTDAIAEAKTIKATAIENAKIALSETISPKLQSMLATKLEEMENEGDEIEEGKEAKEESQTQTEDKSQQNESTEENEDLDEVLAELEKEMGNEAPLSEEEEGEEAETEEGEGEEGEEGSEEGEEINLEDMTDDDLKVFISDVIEDMVTAGELEAGDNFEDGEDEGEEGEIDFNIGDETEGEEGEELTLENEIEESGEDESLLAKIEALIKKTPEFSKKVMKKLEDLGADAGAAMRNESEPSLEEYNELLEENKSTNLLNAKLLYVNKLLKSTRLSEAQTEKILVAFDKATTVKEAKLVFETIEDNFKSSKRRKPHSRNPVIKEGLVAGASRGTSNRTIKKPILESNELVEKFQKLAGIKKQ